MAVALKRDLEAYQKLVAEYQKQADRHNAKVDAYRATFVQTPEGEIAKFDMGRGQTLYNATQRFGPSQVKAMPFGDGKYAARYKDQLDVQDPGEFTATEPGANPAAGYSKAQLKKLDQPSLADIERSIAPSGLIGSKLNY